MGIAGITQRCMSATQTCTSSTFQATRPGKGNPSELCPTSQKLDPQLHPKHQCTRPSEVTVDGMVAVHICGPLRTLQEGQRSRSP